MEKDLISELMDDLYIHGVCISKTHIVDGMVKIERVDPYTDEDDISQYNSTRTDCLMLRQVAESSRQPRTINKGAPK